MDYNNQGIYLHAGAKEDDYLHVVDDELKAVIVKEDDELKAVIVKESKKGEKDWEEEEQAERIKKL
jgi:hypothetical protein